MLLVLSRNAIRLVIGARIDRLTLISVLMHRHTKHVMLSRWRLRLHHLHNRLGNRRLRWVLGWRFLALRIHRGMLLTNTLHRMSVFLVGIGFDRDQILV